MTYSLQVVTSGEQFAALERAWDELVDEAADANTFLTFAWLHSWWVAYRPAAQLRVVTAERQGRLVGIAPMMVQREGGLDRILRRLRFIGDGTSETDHMNFIVHAAEREAVLAALLPAIERIGWDVAYFSKMPESSANTVQLLDYAHGHGWLMDSQLTPCPQRRMPQSYEELLRSLPSRLRTSIRSSRRELAARHELEFGRYSDVGDIPTALQTLFRIHSGRWQAKGGAGVFVDERKRAFYAQLSRRLLDRGTLRFYYLKLDGEVVAQQFCFEHRGTVLLLQEGFDIEHSRHNVGNVLRAMVFEHLIAEGVSTYDFLAGTSRHKQNWSDCAPNDIDLRAIRPTPAGRLLHRVAAWRKQRSQSVPVSQQIADTQQP